MFFKWAIYQFTIGSFQPFNVSLGCKLGENAGSVQDVRNQEMISYPVAPMVLAEGPRL